jgi:acyl-CoA thioester hydrolase
MKIYKTSFRVYYEDTDAGGVVFYGNFLKFAERARTDFLRLSGVNQFTLSKETGLFFVVRRVEIDYLSPGRLDDIITVENIVTKVGKTSIDMNQNFYNQENKPLAKMKTQIVCVQNVDGKNLKSAGLPTIIKEFFEG